MKNILKKIENTSSDCRKEIFQESNIFSSQRQPKNLLILVSNSLQVHKGIFKCNDKRCKICRY